MAIGLNVIGVQGATITIAIHNTGPGPRTVGARVVVTLVDGSHETLVSEFATVQPGATEAVAVSASGDISIYDDPDPVG